MQTSSMSDGKRRMRNRRQRIGWATRIHLWFDIWVTWALSWFGIRFSSGNFYYSSNSKIDDRNGGAHKDQPIFIGRVQVFRSRDRVVVSWKIVFNSGEAYNKLAQVEADGAIDSVADTLESVPWDLFTYGWATFDPGDFAGIADAVNEFQESIKNQLLGDPAKFAGTLIGMPDLLLLGAIADRVPIPGLDRTLGEIRHYAEIAGIILIVLTGGHILACASFKLYIHDLIEKLIAKWIKKFLKELRAKPVKNPPLVGERFDDYSAPDDPGQPPPPGGPHPPDGPDNPDPSSGPNPPPAPSGALPIPADRGIAQAPPPENNSSWIQSIPETVSPERPAEDGRPLPPPRVPATGRSGRARDVGPGGSGDQDERPLPPPRVPATGRSGRARDVGPGGSGDQDERPLPPPRVPATGRSGRARMSDLAGPGTRTSVRCRLRASRPQAVPAGPVMSDLAGPGTRTSVRCRLRASRPQAVPAGPVMSDLAGPGTRTSVRCRLRASRPQAVPAGPVMSDLAGPGTRTSVRCRLRASRPQAVPAGPVMSDLAGPGTRTSVRCRLRASRPQAVPAGPVMSDLAGPGTRTSVRCRLRAPRPQAVPAGMVGRQVPQSGLGIPETSCQSLLSRQGLLSHQGLPGRRPGGQKPTKLTKTILAGIALGSLRVVAPTEAEASDRL